MSITAPTKVQPVYSTEAVFPLSVEQYHEMIRIAVLTDDDPVELIEGVLVFRMPKKPLHRRVTRAVFDVLQGMATEAWHCQIQEPITLFDGEPEPDVTVVRGTLDDYPDRHPGPAETAIVIEVADTTIGRDRGIKLRSYARAGIPQYWIIDLENRSIDVLTLPDNVAPEPRYACARRFVRGDAIEVVLGDVVVGSLNVSDLLK